MVHKLKYLNQTLFPQRNFYSPEWIVLGVNNSCNLHCKMCDVGVGYTESNFYRNLMGSQPVHMPMELFQKIADQTARFYPKAKLGYAFTEPLVYKYLTESLEYAKHKKLYTTLTTNALTLPKMAGNLAKSGLKELYISLDGPAEVHNEIRGYKLSFEKAVEGIEALLIEKNRPQISIFCAITQWNIGRLNEFLDFFNKYPLAHIGFMHTNYTPDSVATTHNVLYGNKYPASASNMQDINLNDYNLELLAKEIQVINKTTRPFKVSFSPQINDLQNLQTFYHQPEKLYGKRCYDVFNAMMIKSNGDIIPAHGRCYNLKIGNLYEQNLQTVWNSGVISRFRKDLNAAGGLLPACSRCCSSFN